MSLGAELHPVTLVARFANAFRGVALGIDDASSERVACACQRCARVVRSTKISVTWQLSDEIIFHSVTRVIEVYNVRKLTV